MDHFSVLCTYFPISFYCLFILFYCFICSYCYIPLISSIYLYPYIMVFGFFCSYPFKFFLYYLFISLYIFSLLSIQISSSYLSDISVPVPMTIPCSHLSVYLSLYFISHKHPLLSFFLSLGWWFCMREVVAFNWAGDELINLSSSYYSKHAKTPLNGLSVIDDDDVDDARRLRGWKWCRKVCTFEVVVE